MYGVWVDMTVHWRLTCDTLYSANGGRWLPWLRVIAVAMGSGDCCRAIPGRKDYVHVLQGYRDHHQYQYNNYKG